MTFLFVLYHNTEEIGRLTWRVVDVDEAYAFAKQIKERATLNSKIPNKVQIYKHMKVEQ